MGKEYLASGDMTLCDDDDTLGDELPGGRDVRMTGAATAGGDGDRAGDDGGGFIVVVVVALFASLGLRTLYRETCLQLSIRLAPPHSAISACASCNFSNFRVMQ